MKKVTLMFILLALLLGLTACSRQQDDDDTIRIGCVATTYPMASFIREAMESYGYTVELVMFDGNALPATALKDGSIDAVFANHLPWIQTFNTEHNLDLQMVEPFFYFSPFRIFSSRHENLEEIPVGATAIIPNDPANRDRSLRMLSEIGFIELQERGGSFYSTLDITNNIMELNFVEMEIISTARSIDDADFVFSMAFIAQQTADIDPDIYLYEDPLSSEYPMGLIVNGTDVNASWAINAMRAMQTEEVRSAFIAQFGTAFTLFN